MEPWKYSAAPCDPGARHGRSRAVMPRVFTRRIQHSRAMSTSVSPANSRPFSTIRGTRAAALRSNAAPSLRAACPLSLALNVGAG